MFFGQKIHPLNFDFADTLTVVSSRVQLAGRDLKLWVNGTDIADGCLRLRFENAHAADSFQHSDAVLPELREGCLITPRIEDNTVIFTAAAGRAELGAKQLRLELAGFTLETVAEGIGGCSDNLLLNFDINGVDGCYGFGERTKRLNKLGDSTDCLTVDVVSVFRHSYARDDYDPTYVAIPFAILKRGEHFIGLFFDNSGRAVMDVGKIRPGEFCYQSFGGLTDLYILAGPTLLEVVRRYAKLTGQAPLPPLWALGYHQCRWSYQNAAEFRELAANFAATDIPVSALWYDIDYMDGFRLFTWNRASFPTPAALNLELQAAGIRTVAIIDPGVKRELGYPVYDHGREQQVFCQTASGRDYVGKVWPGDTVFPDFTLDNGRDWWANELADFLRNSALDGVWLDMNDPATGYSRTEEMRFHHGAISHDRYHNQYAHFMAKASRKACEQLEQKGRPFLLTRSACAGTQRYSAVWTGDNASNWKHLRMALPCSLNLSLSGIAFNGPDVGGFMGDVTAELLVRWHQACCLFPFFRNHSILHSRRQEPWQFGPEPLAAIRGAIRSRYRLLPYLYQCFFNHWRNGDPVIRPLLYHYPGPEYTDLDDQYLLGDSLLVAPILHGDSQGPEIFRNGVKMQQRSITLPPGGWFDLNRGVWLEGGRTVNYAAALDELPLFVRDGAIVPYYAGPLHNNFMNLSDVELHLFCHNQSARLNYFVDDQESLHYQSGDISVADIAVSIGDERLRVAITESGSYPKSTVRFTPVIYDHSDLRELELTVNHRVEARSLRVGRREWLCRELAVQF